MSISRRLFIRLGTFAAIASGVSMRPGLITLAQKFGAPPQTDPLSYYSMATFLQYVNSVFILRSATATVEVTLTSVQDTLPAGTSRAGGRDSFILEFRGGSRRLPQDTYNLEHPALGAFGLFLVPSGADETGIQSYAATINRLAYLNKPDAPRKFPLKSSPVRGTSEIGVHARLTQRPAPEAKPGRKGKTESESNFDINF